MKLSTLPLTLQITFDSHLYNTGEKKQCLHPWGIARDETGQMRVCSVVALLYLILKIVLILQTFIHRCEHIRINNYSGHIFISVCMCAHLSVFMELHPSAQKTRITIASIDSVSSCARHCLVIGILC